MLVAGDAKGGPKRGGGVVAAIIDTYFAASLWNRLVVLYLGIIMGWVRYAGTLVTDGRVYDREARDGKSKI